MARPQVLVYGFYGKGNVGDEAFKTAFAHLWPRIEFTFTDVIPGNAKGFDALWIGGGSLLESPIPRLSEVSLPLGFIGVGGTSVHPGLVPHLQKAKISVVRDTKTQAAWPTYAELGPDLTFGVQLDDDLIHYGTGTQVSVLLNDALRPDAGCAEFKRKAFEPFIREMSQACDELVHQGHEVVLIPMCVNRQTSDLILSREVLGRMNHSHGATILSGGERAVRYHIARSSFIISARLHGAIFAAQAGTPFVLIRSHDKMLGFLEDSGWKASVDYYGFTEEALDSAIESALQQRETREYVEGAWTRWRELSGLVERAFFS